MQLIYDNWPIVLVALAIALVAAFLLMRRRQRVELSKDNVPVRPHMARTTDRSGEGKGIASEAAAAVSDVSGQIIGVPVHAHLPGASGPPDDLTLLKGVGPKLAASLNALGIVRFDQLASLTEGELERLDQHLGPFKGRLERDQIVLQADYLARGDRDGFEQRFGKL